MQQKDNQSGSATAELVVALPFLILLSLVGVRFVGATIHEERLRFLAEGVVQAVMRQESDSSIERELDRAIPGARFTITEGKDGAFTVTVRHHSSSAEAAGYR